MTREIADEEPAMDQVAKPLATRFPDIEAETIAALVREVYVAPDDARERSVKFADSSTALGSCRRNGIV